MWPHSELRGMLIAATKETGRKENGRVHRHPLPSDWTLKETQGSLTRLLKGHPRRKLKGKCFS